MKARVPVLSTYHGISKLCTLLCTYLLLRL